MHETVKIFIASLLDRLSIIKIRPGWHSSIHLFDIFSECLEGLSDCGGVFDADIACSKGSSLDSSVLVVNLRVILHQSVDFLADCIFYVKLLHWLIGVDSIISNSHYLSFDSAELCLQVESAFTCLWARNFTTNVVWVVSSIYLFLVG